MASAIERLKQEMAIGGSGGFDGDMDYVILPLPDGELWLKLAQAADEIKHFVGGVSLITALQRLQENK